MANKRPSLERLMKSVRKLQEKGYLLQRPDYSPILSGAIASIIPSTANKASVRDEKATYEPDEPKEH